MFFNNFVSILQLIASPLFFATATVASIFLTVALVRLFGAQRRLARARRLLIEADLAERGVGSAGKRRRKGQTPGKDLKPGAGQEPNAEQKSGAEQRPGDEGEEAAGAQ